MLNLLFVFAIYLVVFLGAMFFTIRREEKLCKDGSKSASSVDAKCRRWVVVFAVLVLAAIVIDLLASFHCIAFVSEDLCLQALIVLSVPVAFITDKLTEHIFWHIKTR